MDEPKLMTLVIIPDGGGSSGRIVSIIILNVMGGYPILGLSGFPALSWRKNEHENCKDQTRNDAKHRDLPCARPGDRQFCRVFETGSKYLLVCRAVWVLLFVQASAGQSADREYKESPTNRRRLKLWVVHGWGCLALAMTPNRLFVCAKTKRPSPLEEDRFCS